RAERRQVEPFPDLLLNLFAAPGRVDRDHALFAAEDLKYRVGLLVVLPQPDRERLLGAVLPGHQRRAANITAAGDARAAGDPVVVHPAARAQPPGEHAPADLAVGQVEVDHAVDVIALEE